MGKKREEDKLTSTHAPFQCFDDWHYFAHTKAAGADHTHTPAAAGVVHGHTLPAKEEDTAIRTQTAEAEDDYTAPTDRDTDAAAAVDNAGRDIPARNLAVQHQAGAVDCSMVQT